MARELKYSTHATDLDALRRELSTGSEGPAERDDEDQDEDQDDGWARASR